MPSGEGRLIEIVNTRGGTQGRIHCLPALIPAPGQYVLADAIPGGGQAASVVAVPLFRPRVRKGAFSVPVRCPNRGIPARTWR